MPRLRVAPEIVLAAAAALVAEAAELRSQLAARLEAMHLQHSGGDPTSLLAARAMTAALLHAPGSVVTRCLDHAGKLDQLADQLAEAARTYGRTEEEIAAAFAKREPDAGEGPPFPGDAGDRPGGSLRQPRVI